MKIITLNIGFCSKSINSKCKYQIDKITRMLSYKPSTGLPVALKQEIQKIFQDVTSDEPLFQCLKGITQNTNEFFNQFVL